MPVRIRDLLLLAAAAAAVGGCRAAQWSMGGAKPQRNVVATTMPAEDAVKVFDQALALVADLRYEQAGAKFRSVVDSLDEAGDHRRAAEAVFWFGYCREKQGHLDSAKKLYKRLIEKFPKSVAAGRAADRLAALGSKPARP